MNVLGNIILSFWQQQLSTLITTSSLPVTTFLQRAIHNSKLNLVQIKFWFIWSTQVQHHTIRHKSSEQLLLVTFVVLAGVSEPVCNKLVMCSVSLLTTLHAGDNHVFTISLLSCRCVVCALPLLWLAYLLRQSNHNSVITFFSASLFNQFILSFQVEPIFILGKY